MNVITLKKRLLPGTVESKMNLRSALRWIPHSRRALGDVNAAMRDLDLSDAEILQLIEQRKLIGFNICGEGTQRSETRILTYSIEHFRRNHGREALVISWPEIFQLIFPVANPFAPRLPGLLRTFTSHELQQGLNCSRRHVANLARSYFKIVRPASRGRGHMSCYDATVVEQWLKGRMR